jgi:Uma2 family endonuclease
VLPLPTEEHQLIVAFLYEKVKAFVAPQGLGKVLFAPLSVQLWEEKFRQPDVIFMLAENAGRRSNDVLSQTCL